MTNGQTSITPSMDSGTAQVLLADRIDHLTNTVQDEIEARKSSHRILYEKLDDMQTAYGFVRWFMIPISVGLIIALVRTFL